ncbi:hypothetical protein AUP41_08330 [Thalassospira xiamenensis]|nr:hypothetical protein AUP41_08330 [Thalassospira xiamenensis]
MKEIVQERQRQIEDEGYDAHHDSLHDPDVIATGGAFYALPEETTDWVKAKGVDLWPFDDQPKRKDRRRDLIRAASMIVAEIEQLDDTKKKSDRTVTLKANVERIKYALEKGQTAAAVIDVMVAEHGASIVFGNGTYHFRLAGLTVTRTAGKEAVLKGWCAAATKKVEAA